MTTPDPINVAFELLMDRLKRRQVRLIGSFSVAKETACFLRQLVLLSEWKDVDCLIREIQKKGYQLWMAQPSELVVDNITKRVLKLIREVVAQENTKKNQRPDQATLKSMLVQEITEDILTELDSVYKGISDQALDFIHADEVIMTTGQSNTVQTFLISAAQKRKFQVIVAESAPSYQGHSTALALSKAGIDTTVITDSAILAVIPRVHKVVLGAHAVMASGALISQSGSCLLAAAAKHHTKPVLVCTALYKLSPLFSYHQDQLNVPVSPQHVLRFQEGSLVDQVAVSQPYYDHIHPDHVNLFIHNLGSAPPTYIYRLINDHYDPEDSLQSL
ncbi:hypothetical protein BY458DRAFT_588515 [Sporodiniella umbellata]|nr:hypothetical protein BY458DRAFT_588515 [Sporodiniella umbellata]